MPDDAAGRSAPEKDRLLAYVADLELEVDRLRRQGAFLEREATRSLLEILQLCTGPAAGEPLPTLAEVEATARQLVEVVKDLHDAPGYHPAHDQVVSVAVRPLAEQVFRWQQRLTGTRAVKLRLELDIDHVEWFPARLRHILDNLLAHALRHRDPAAPDQWVALGLRASPTGYELRVSDNGNGPPPGEDRRVLELFFRAAPLRETGLGAGLSVVKLLVEQSGGTLRASPRPGRGADFLLTLPRYDLLDYLESGPHDDHRGSADRPE
jgi:signal transduction histidine kinase